MIKTLFVNFQTDWLPEEKSSFWRLIWIQTILYIKVLIKLNADTLCYRYLHNPKIRKTIRKNRLNETTYRLFIWMVYV